MKEKKDVMLIKQDILFSKSTNHKFMQVRHGGAIQQSRTGFQNRQNFAAALLSESKLIKVLFFETFIQIILAFPVVINPLGFFLASRKLPDFYRLCVYFNSYAGFKVLDKGIFNSRL